MEFQQFHICVVQRIEIVASRVLAFVGQLSLFVLCDLRDSLSIIQDELVPLPSGSAAVSGTSYRRPHGRTSRSISLLWTNDIPIRNVAWPIGNSFHFSSSSFHPVELCCHLLSFFKGCQYREHTVQIFNDRDRAILKLSQIAGDGGCLYEPPPVKVPVMNATNAYSPWWNELVLLPQRDRHGLLPAFTLDGIG